ncbi:hypothetical protein DFH08DRAFT_1051793 [Mycena albidolilacea]|uniref:Uncharacterized protein n=1 Tax=Mycena albidolilacea TaxID=1033008 RepID=A0AAD7EB20_9AGAR|nr:hypothetical protein DFH08DRAFT_1051793 [Mycena albidolilacea]
MRTDAHGCAWVRINSVFLCLPDPSVTPDRPLPWNRLLGCEAGCDGNEVVADCEGRWVKNGFAARELEGGSEEDGAAHKFVGGSEGEGDVTTGGAWSVWNIAMHIVRVLNQEVEKIGVASKVSEEYPGNHETAKRCYQRSMQPKPPHWAVQVLQDPLEGRVNDIIIDQTRQAAASMRQSCGMDPTIMGTKFARVQPACASDVRKPLLAQPLNILFGLDCQDSYFQPSGPGPPGTGFFIKHSESAPADWESNCPITPICFQPSQVRLGCGQFCARNSMQLLAPDTHFAPHAELYGQTSYVYMSKEVHVVSAHRQLGVTRIEAGGFRVDPIEREFPLKPSDWSQKSASSVTKSNVDEGGKHKAVCPEMRRV